MDAGKIDGANMNLGQPPNWDPAKDGVCRSLDIRKGNDERGHVVLQSAWTPDLAELAALNAGGSVILTIYGYAHPPVSVDVSLPPVKNG